RRLKTRSAARTSVNSTPALNAAMASAPAVSQNALLNPARRRNVRAASDATRRSRVAIPDSVTESQTGEVKSTSSYEVWGMSFGLELVRVGNPLSTPAQ